MIFNTIRLIPVKILINNIINISMNKSYNDKSKSKQNINSLSLSMNN